jgi:predicted SprT family Zn-dependent metalloprotease
LRLDDAENLAKELMAKYGLNGYQFQFDNAVRRFGSCNLEKKLIKLSKPLTLMNSESYVRNVLLHEISHALCWELFRTRGHGALWNWIAENMGFRNS